MPNHDHYARALRQLAPGASWALVSGVDLVTGKTVDALQWHDPVVPQPGFQRVLALASQFEHEEKPSE